MEKKYIKYPITFLLTIILLGFVRYNISSNRIKNKLTKFFIENPQEKIYIHLDKNIYSVKEHIWFKTYYFTDSPELTDSLSKLFYIELINQREEIIATKILKINNAITYGDFYISDSLFYGVYQIRAYTNWMRNYNNLLIPRKYIFIYNNKSTYKVKKDRNLSKNKKKQKLEFYSEGGKLTFDINNQLIIKTSNSYNSLSVKGDIIDNYDNIITSFQTNKYGFDKVLFTPKNEFKYYARLLDIKKKKKTPLPEISHNNLVLHVKNSTDSIKLLISKSDTKLKKIYILCHTKGKIFYSQEFNIENKLEINIPISNLDPGIAYIKIFNNTGIKLNERLISINEYKLPKIHLYMVTNKLSDDKTQITIKTEITSFNDNALTGNYSASIQINKNNRSLNNYNINAYYLFLSDLNYNNYTEYDYNIINNYPANIDNILISSIPVRYNANNNSAQEFSIEKGINISGTIRNDIKKTRAPGCNVKLTIHSEYYDIMNTISDYKGRFSFNNLEYNDTIEISLKATNEKRNNIYIEIDNELPPNVTFNTRFKKYVLKNHFSKIKKVANLSNNTTYSNETTNVKSNGDITTISGNLDNYSSVLDAIRGKVPGVNVTGNSVNIRGKNIANQNRTPLLLVDGMEVNSDILSHMSTYDIERIEIIRGTSSAQYGFKGGNGVIRIYTKRAKHYKKGELNFKILGYCKANTFKYISQENSLNTLPKTIYWNPNVLSDSLGIGSFDFIISDTIKRVNIQIEGFTENGYPFSLDKELIIQ